MSHLSEILRTQEEESKRLMEVIESFSKDDILLEKDIKLQQDPLFAEVGDFYDSTRVAGKDLESTVPDDFIFRQNELRNDDLEVEERALLNLQAQEYDAMRLI